MIILLSLLLPAHDCDKINVNINTVHIFNIAVDTANFVSAQTLYVYHITESHSPIAKLVAGRMLEVGEGGLRKFLPNKY